MPELATKDRADATNYGARVTQMQAGAWFWRRSVHVFVRAI